MNTAAAKKVYDGYSNCNAKLSAERCRQTSQGLMTVTNWRVVIKQTPRNCYCSLGTDYRINVKGDMCVIRTMNFYQYPKRLRALLTLYKPEMSPNTMSCSLKVLHWVIILKSTAEQTSSKPCPPFTRGITSVREHP